MEQAPFTLTSCGFVPVRSLSPSKAAASCLQQALTIALTVMVVMLKTKMSTSSSKISDGEY